MSAGVASKLELLDTYLLLVDGEPRVLTIGEWTHIKGCIRTEMGKLEREIFVAVSALNGFKSPSPKEFSVLAAKWMPLEVECHRQLKKANETPFGRYLMNIMVSERNI